MWGLMRPRAQITIGEYHGPFDTRDTLDDRSRDEFHRSPNRPGENGGEKLGHGSGGMELLRAA